MSTRIDVNFILNTIDEVRQKCSQQSTITDRGFIGSIQELFNSCKQALIQLSTVPDTSQQMTEDEINAERIVSKLKELRYSLGDRCPQNLNSFPRDAFNFGSYHIEVVEFFYPIPFYSIINCLVKLYRWSVYSSNGMVVCNYYLEKSEVKPGNPYYVLGKFSQDGHTHTSLKAYGSTAPSYNQIKSHVINYLND